MNVKDPNKNTQLFIFLVIVISAAAIRFYELGSASLWLDEAITIRNSSLEPFGRFGSGFTFFALEHFSLFFGNDEFFLRLPSAVSGVLAVVIVFYLTKMVSNFWAAVGAATILTFSFSNIEFSQEARYYAPLGVFIGLSFLGLLHHMRKTNSNDSIITISEFLKTGGWLYTISLLAALYTHVTAVFFWLAVQFIFLGNWYFSKKLSLNYITTWTIINLIVLVLWTPVFLKSAAIVSGSGFWLEQPSLLYAISTLGSVHSVTGIWGIATDVNNMLLFAINLPFVMFGLYGLYSLRNNAVIFISFLSLLICSSLVIWIFGFVVTPVFMFRSVLWGTIFSSILIGIGMSKLPARFMFAIYIVLLSIGVSNIYIYSKYDRGENEDWRSAASTFKKNNMKGDILLFCSDYITEPFLYYVESEMIGPKVFGWRKNIDEMVSGSLVEGESRPDYISWDSEKTQIPDSQSYKSANQLWIVDSHCQDTEKNGHELISQNGWKEEKKFNFKGPISLYLFSR